MQISLSGAERVTCLDAIERIRKATDAAIKASVHAALATLPGDAQLSAIGSAELAITSAKEFDDVEIGHAPRLCVLFGIRILMEQVQKTQEREGTLLIDTSGSIERMTDLKRLAKRLGDQKELELTSATLDLAGRA